jgi:hypothetical protein
MSGRARLTLRRGILLAPMPDVLTALDAFLQEHRRCGDLEGGVEGERVWMTCDCGAAIVQPVPPAGPDL